MAPLSPVDSRDVLKCGPAVPQRTRRTMSWGIQAYLPAVSVCTHVQEEEDGVPFVDMEESHPKHGN